MDKKFFYETENYEQGKILIPTAKRVGISLPDGFTLTFQDRRGPANYEQVLVTSEEPLAVEPQVSNSFALSAAQWSRYIDREHGAIRTVKISEPPDMKATEAALDALETIHAYADAIEHYAETTKLKRDRSLAGVNIRNACRVIRSAIG